MVLVGFINLYMQDWENLFKFKKKYLKIVEMIKRILMSLIRMYLFMGTIQ